jgi:hypothetical protein
MRRLGDKHYHAVAPFILLLCPALSYAQSIDTNRPGFSFTTGIVDVGMLQVETGIGYKRVDSSTDTVALPEADIRFGIAERVEAFVSSVSWERTDSAGTATRGLTDPDAGIKMKIGADDGALQMALLLKVSLPVGDDALSSDRWDPTAGLIWMSGGRLPLAGTLTVNNSSSGYQVDNGLKLPIMLGERRAVFVEWEANLPEHGGSAHWLNSGFQWLSGERVQFDLNVGLGLNDRAGDFRAGVGFSIRL